MTDNQNQTTEKRKPDLFIHVKRYKGVSNIVGSRVGVGFLHSNGVGINIILDAQPIPNHDGQIELVGFPADKNN